MTLSFKLPANLFTDNKLLLSIFLKWKNVLPLIVTVQNMLSAKINIINLKKKHAKTSCQQGYFYKHGFLGGALFWH